MGPTTANLLLSGQQGNQIWVGGWWKTMSGRDMICHLKSQQQQHNCMRNQLTTTRSSLISNLLFLLRIFNRQELRKSKKLPQSKANGPYATQTHTSSRIDRQRTALILMIKWDLYCAILSRILDCRWLSEFCLSASLSFFLSSSLVLGHSNLIVTNIYIIVLPLWLLINAICIRHTDTINQDGWVSSKLFFSFSCKMLRGPSLFSFSTMIK